MMAQAGKPRATNNRPSRDSETTLDMSKIRYGHHRGRSAVERDVLCDAARGPNNIQIGAKQFRSPETIRTHMKHIMSKLNVRRHSASSATSRSSTAEPTTPSRAPAKAR